MKCNFSTLGCPNDAIETIEEFEDGSKKTITLYCDYHTKEFDYFRKVIKKLPDQWTNEEREEFHKLYGFTKKPM